MVEHLNAERIQIAEISNLVSELKNVEIWSNNPEIGMEILRKISALLISLDTRGVFKRLRTFRSGPDLRKFPEVIKQLLDPILQDKFIDLTIIDKNNPLIFIHKGDGSHIDEMTNHLTEPYAYKRPVKIDKPLIHAHFDTVDFKGRYGSNDALKSRNSDLIIGRGSNDMKGQIASLIMLIYKLWHENCSNFFIVLTSNEEYNWDEEFEVFRKVQAPVAFDIEPTGFHSGVFANQISPSICYSPLRKITNEVINREVMNSLGKYIQTILYAVTEEILSINVFLANDRLNISVEGNRNIDQEPYLASAIKIFLKEICKISSRKLQITFGDYPSFLTKRSSKIESLIIKSASETALPKVEYPNQAEHTCRFIGEDNNAQFGKIFGGFMTQLSLSMISQKNDIYIGSVAEVGPRHSDFEAVSVTDLWNFMRFMEKFLINFGNEG